MSFSLLQFKYYVVLRERLRALQAQIESAEITKDMSDVIREAGDVNVLAGDVRRSIEPRSAAGARRQYNALYREVCGFMDGGCGFGIDWRTLKSAYPYHAEYLQFLIAQQRDLS